MRNGMTPLNQLELVASFKGTLEFIPFILPSHRSLDQFAFPGPPRGLSCSVTLEKKGTLLGKNPCFVGQPLKRNWGKKGGTSGTEEPRGVCHEVEPRKAPAAAELPSPGTP